MKNLDTVFVVPCRDNRRNAWCRVVTNRGEVTRLNDMSWPLARRIVPKLLARYGAEVPVGFWGGCVPALLD